MKSILKNIQTEEVDLMKEATTNTKRTQLCLVLEFLLGLKYIEECRNALGNFIKLIRMTDTTEHECNIELSNGKAHS